MHVVEYPLPVSIFLNPNVDRHIALNRVVERFLELRIDFINNHRHVAVIENSHAVTILLQGDRPYLIGPQLRRM